MRPKPRLLFIALVLPACTPEGTSPPLDPVPSAVPSPSASRTQPSRPRTTVTAEPCAIISPRVVSCLRKGTFAPLIAWQKLGDEVPKDERFVHLETMDERVCALLEPSGSILCWSTRPPGDVRGRAFFPAPTAQPVAGVVDFALLSDALCTLDSRGHVSCWGENNQGQLGDGTSEPREHPLSVELPDAAIDLVGSRGSACALLQSGEVHCWGDNPTEGDLRRLKPERIRGLQEVRALESTRWVALADGAWARWNIVDHLPDYAFTEAQRVETAKERYGRDYYLEGTVATCPGRDDEPPIVIEGVAELHNNHNNHNATCLRRTDGTVWCAGGRIPLSSAAPEIPIDEPTLVPGITGVTNVAAHGDAVCVIHDEGAVACWGGGDHLPHRPRQRDGFLGTPTPVPLPGPATDLVVDTAGACATVSGQAHCWGRYGQIRVLGPASSLLSLAGRPCADSRKGLYCLDGGLGRGEQVRLVEPPASVATQYNRRCLRVRPRLQCEWGVEDLSCPPEPDTACTFEYDSSPTALEFDRALTIGPRDRVLVGGGGVCALSPSGNFSCASTHAGLASYRGFDIESEPNIIAAEVGFRSVCAIAQGGALHCWSGSPYIAEPGRRLDLRVDDAVSIAMGDLGGYFVREDGSLWSWGVNDRGQRGLGGESWAVSDVPVRIDLLGPGAALPKR